MRKNLKIFSKKGTSFILALALIIAYFMPIVPVFATSNTTTTLSESANINIHIKGAELGYDMPWDDAAVSFAFGINNNPEMRRLDKDEVNYTRENDEIVGLQTKEALNYQYDYNNEGTVTFHIRSQIDDLYTSLKINGVPYATPQTKDELANAVKGWDIEFDIPNVPYSDTYNIEVVGRKQNDAEKVVGNFAWTYDANSNEYSEDDRILHGTLDFVKAEYNNVIYTKEDFNNAGELFNWNDGVRDTDDPTGEALLPVGTILTLRLTPDAGYQLTSFDLNGNPFETGDKVGLYTFTIGGGNWHLGAHFTEVGNEVISDSVNVKNGDINISNEQSFSNGTAKLEVNDVASMASNRMEGFESKATDEGYDIENYLDISLYNSIYKGGKKDSNGNYESWDTPVENIDNKATITLELENDMSGKNLAIVHETHNGDEITGYELIDAVYNEENNTITFETDSFSNYAIISKESTETTKYTVTFNSNGGSEIESKKVTTGNSVAEPTAPTNGDKVFDGWFEDETLTTRFDFNTPITSNVTLYAKWIDNEESDNSETEKYTITDSSGNVISFTEEKDREFTLNIIDYLTFSLEDLENAGIPKDMYDSMMEMLVNATKNYGTLLSVYEIEVRNDDGYLIHEGPFNIKIKMTDEMKKYNTFKLIYLDDENNFKGEDIVDLKVNGEYIEGTLPHLSVYALVGDNVETETTTTEKTDNSETTTTEKTDNSETTTTEKTDNSKNPKTGDNIIMTISIFAVATLGAYITLKLNRNRYMRKH